MIRCYVLAANQSEAEQAAWDLDFTADLPDDAQEFPSVKVLPNEKKRLYEVTITAKRKPGAK